MNCERDPTDEILEHELAVADRRNKKEIRHLEQELPKWQVLVDSVTGISPPDFDNQTLAVLRGRLVRYLMRSREITLGRATKDNQVDVDLALEGPAWKISRRQGVIKLFFTGEFFISNEGKRPIYVDGKPILGGIKQKLNNNSVVEKDHLACLRDNQGSSLMLRMYSLNEFADGAPITQDFLQKLEQDFKAAKDAGWSLVLRFMYQNSLDTQYNPQSEPTIAQIKEHIKQLAPVIARYDGVVVAVQAGFHGEYGLWYTPGTNSTKQDTAIIDTLLTELPSTMPVQVAHPDYKTGKMTIERIGHFHECLLEGDTNDLKHAFPDLSTDTGALSYLTNDTETSVIGGKTCHPGDTTKPPRNLCIDSEKLFKSLHLTYLNINDPDEAIKNYKKYGCFKTLSDVMGYRLALESVTIPDNVNVNTPVCVGITLSNRGYASPFRQYNVSIVLQNTVNNSIVYEAAIPTDTTRWLPGSDIHLKQPLTSQLTLKLEQLTRFLEPNLGDNTDYFVVLANSKLVPVNGLNSVGSFQVVASSTINPTFAPTSTLQTWTLPKVSTNPRTWHQVTRSCLQIPNGPPVSSTSLPVTTAPPVFTTTVTPATTTQFVSTLPPPFVSFSNDTSNLAICRKFDTVKALLQFTYFTHPSTPECPNTSSRATPEVIPISFCSAPTDTSYWKPKGRRTDRYELLETKRKGKYKHISPEAIPRLFCSAPTDTSYWKPKGRVIDNCERIPMYARIGVFSNQGLYGYDTSIRKCGVFLGCLKSGSKVVGVKIGMQVCGRPFDIENARFSNEKDLVNLYVF
ncbi:INO80Q [Mytilus edulis]|uniref:Microspherule protein 1 n=1 Tax=Mytilus edulis TaxID=6550 RepID=A0A8S3U3H2_MYTED|nr:INO80Q [Mytilus edulis]